VQSADFGRQSLFSLALLVAFAGNDPGLVSAQGRVTVTVPVGLDDLVGSDHDRSGRALGAPAGSGWSRILPMKALADVARGVTSRPLAARERATRLLGRVGDRQAALATLTTLVERESASEVRDAALEGLLRRGRAESVPLWLSLHRRGEARDRHIALRALGEQVRAAVAAHDASGAAGAPAAATWEPAARELIGALAIGGERDAAVAALHRGGPITVPLLLRALGEPEASVGAARALGRLGDDRALAPLVALSHSDRIDVRLAAVEALGDLADARAAPALAARLEDPAPSVVDAALRALARAGDVSVLERVAPHARFGGPERRLAAVATLLALDPERGARQLDALLKDGPADLGPGLRALLLSSRHPALASLLATRLRSDVSAHAVASALAVLDEGAGLPTLLAEARAVRSSSRRDPMAAPVLRALAVAARTWRDVVDARVLDEVCALLSELDEANDDARILFDDEALLLPAIACDPRASPGRVAAVRARALTVLRARTADAEASGGPGPAHRPAVTAASRLDPDVACAKDSGAPAHVALRAAAARALAATCVTPVDDALVAPAVAEAISVETDAEVVRALTEAALRCGVDVPLGSLAAWRNRAETAAEAMASSILILARTSETAGSRTTSAAARRALLREAYAALRHGDEALRAATALALADVHLPVAEALLAEVVDDDASVHVRRAAARALAARLPSARADLREWAAGAARATDDAVVRDLLEFGLQSPVAAPRSDERASAGRASLAAARAPRAVSLPPREGREVLWLRFALADGPTPAGLEVVLRFADGTVRRQRTLRDGALYVLDLPAGDADVEVLGVAH
jgi:HEAT repeat protein